MGSYPQQPEDVLHLKNTDGVTAILNLQSDVDLETKAIQWELFEQFYEQQGMVVVRVPIVDFEPTDLLGHLPAGVDALQQLMEAEHKVYVHCNVGINRSPTVCIAWLAQHGGLSLEQAIKHVMERRSCYPYPEVLAAWDHQRA